MLDSELVEWLSTLKINQEIDLNGDKLFLRVLDTGAVLGIELVANCEISQIKTAMQMGFGSAVSCDAGLALNPENRSLQLTQWLPGINSWNQAASDLEKLLNHFEVWQAALKPTTRTLEVKVSRSEERLRNLLLKKTA